MPRGTPKTITDDEAREHFRESAAQLGLDRNLVSRILKGEKFSKVASGEQKWTMDAIGRLMSGEDINVVAKSFEMTPKQLLRLMEVPQRFQTLILSKAMSQMYVVLMETIPAMMEILKREVSDKNISGKTNLIHVILKAAGMMSGDLTPKEPARSREELQRKLKEYQDDLKLNEAVNTDVADFLKPDEDELH